MQLIFFLLWVIVLGVWITMIYFIRTQLRTVDGIRPAVNYVFAALIAASLMFFAIALMNVITYREPQGSVSTPTTTQSPNTTTPRSIRSTGNEKVY